MKRTAGPRRTERKGPGGEGESRRPRDPRAESRPSGPRSAEVPGEDETEFRAFAVGFHSVRTALELHPRKVERLLLARGQRDHRTHQIVEMAREKGIPFQQVPKEALDRIAEGVQHQGIAARLAARELIPEDELIQNLPADPVVLVLDGVQDPRNVGAILRTAAAFGVDGVFLPGHRSAGLSPAAARTAAGGLELIPVARAGNVGHLLEELENRGIPALALDLEAAVEPWETDLTGPLALVAGGEEKGIRPSVLDHCAVRVKIPVRPEIGSLNVSVAVGILLGEVVRQRRTKAKK